MTPIKLSDHFTYGRLLRYNTGIYKQHIKI